MELIEETWKLDDKWNEDWHLRTAPDVSPLSSTWRDRERESKRKLIVAQKLVPWWGWEWNYINSAKDNCCSYSVHPTVSWTFKQFWVLRTLNFGNCCREERKWETTARKKLVWREGEREKVELMSEICLFVVWGKKKRVEQLNSKILSLVISLVGESK